MDQAFGYFGLGLWFGFTGPLVVHGGAVFVQHITRRHDVAGSITALTRVIQFVVYPILMLGVLGIASVIGQLHGSANFFTPGMLVGVAVYCVCAWLRRKAHKANADADA